MRGVILAGGKGTRLEPCTKITNKHLLPVNGKPMIYYPLEFLKKHDIHQILVITGPDHCGDFIELLGDGSEFGVELTYRVQMKADGIAGALSLAEDFTKNENFVVILGDNIFTNKINLELKKDKDAYPRPIAKVFFVYSKDPRRFGCPKFENEKIVEIIEKPEEPPSQLAQVGLYVYDKCVFRFIDAIEPSKRGELEITDVNNFYLQKGDLQFETLTGKWCDAGTWESLEKASQIAKEFNK